MDKKKKTEKSGGHSTKKSGSEKSDSPKDEKSGPESEEPPVNKLAIELGSTIGAGIAFFRHWLEIKRPEKKVADGEDSGKPRDNVDKLPVTGNKEAETSPVNSTNLRKEDPSPENSMYGVPSFKGKAKSKLSKSLLKSPAAKKSPDEFEDRALNFDVGETDVSPTNTLYGMPKLKKVTNKTLISGSNKEKQGFKKRPPPPPKPETPTSDSDSDSDEE